MFTRRSTSLVLLLALGASACASWGGGAKTPLYEGVTAGDSRVSLQNERARSYFDQGLTFAYARNLQKAEQSFREAAALEPDHPAGWWGVALVNGPDLNAPFGERESE
ncbi:MAG: tetratricopeptide repeat protein, partial [Planctomycetota bacterium]